MLKLKILKFNNIRRFVTEQTIDFSNRESMLQFDGKNLNTGGSSGSGKSTVAMAVDYLFGVNEVSATALQSFLTKDGIYVEAFFDKEGKEVIISRSKKGGLSVSIDGEITSGSSKAAEEKLDEVIGMDRDIFRKTYHKRQKEGGFFLDMGPTEVYKFLSDVLNVNQWTSKAPIIDAQVKNLEIELVKERAKKTNFENSVVNFQELVLNLKKPEKNFDDTKLPEYLENQAALKKDMSSFSVAMDNEIAQITKPERNVSAASKEELIRLETLITQIKSSIETITSQEAAKLNTMRKSSIDISNQIASLRRANDMIPGLEKQKSSLLVEKDHITGMKCPTCTQIWVGNSASQKITLLESDILNLENKISIISDEFKKTTELQATLDRLQGIISKKEMEDVAKDLREQLAQNQSDFATEKKNIEQHSSNQEREYEQLASKYREQCQDIKDIWTSKFNATKDLLTSTELIINEISIKSRSYKESLNYYDSNKNNLSKSLKDAEDNLNSTISIILSIEEKIAIAQETKRFIKSYVTKIFQDCLQEIGDKASSILANIPNMQNANIYFETAKENKDGKIKEEVTGIINMDGENEFPIKSLSGGERTAIDLAVDFAVIDLIESRSGKGMDFFIMDEPFNGLDSVSSIAVVDLLKTLDTNKRVILIDHNESTKEVVGDVITVVRDGVESSVLI